MYIALVPFCIAIIFKLKRISTLHKYFIWFFFFLGKINCKTKMDIKSQGVNVHIVFIYHVYIYLDYSLFQIL